jgi:alpha-tubulin suppressor-like RCC1 family protein
MSFKNCPLVEGVRRSPPSNPLLFTTLISQGTVVPMFPSRYGYFRLVLDTEQRIWVCGDNYYGQLGTGDKSDSSCFVHAPQWKGLISMACGNDFTLGLDSNGSVWIAGSLPTGGEQLMPSQIQGLSSIKQISCGGSHFLALDENQVVWGFGSNYCSQLGMGKCLDQLRAQPCQISCVQIQYVSCGYEFSVVLDCSGNVWTFGSNQYGELGLGDFVGRNSPCQILNLDNIQSIESGAYFGMAIDTQHRVFSWGYNAFGNLGLGNRKHTTTPTEIQNLFIQSVHAGGFHTVCVDLTGIIWVFGKNNHG